MGVEEPTFPHTPHTTTQPHKRREVSPHISHNHKKPKLTVVRPTEEELTLQATVRKLTWELQLMERELTLQAMERELTPQLQPTVRRPTPQPMVEKLMEEELTLHHTERKLTLQLQPTEVKLTEDVLTPQLQLMEVKPTVETLTEVKLTEEEPTGVNNTVTRRGTQIDCFAELFENHQIPTKKLKIDNCVFIFLCFFDIFNKLH